MVIMSSDSLMLRSPQSQNHISLRGVVRNQSSFLNRVNIGNSVQSAQILADGYEKFFGHLRQPIDSFEVLSLGGYPIISGWLLNSLISNRTANMQSAYNLSVSLADSQNLYTSLRGAQILRPSFSQAQKEKDSTANATLWDHAFLRNEINQLVNYNSLRSVVNQVNNFALVSYCSDDALALRCWSSSCATPISNLISSLTFVPISSTRARASRDESSGSLQLPPLWRRAISTRIAVIINPALLSLPCFTASIPSITSCGTRTVVNCDFAFLFGVGINETPYNWCVSLYTKKKYKKALTCVSYESIVKHTLRIQGIQIAKPSSARTLTGPLTKNVKESYAMDTPQHNQTRLKFTFLIASGTQRLVDIHPVRLITVLADSEGEARLLVGIPSLIFVSRQEVTA
ncbi:hypothetical protein Xvie_03847 [Xenorhabdus vietnamensis]|uniref:Uncharacterized protein n=2 Tax=Xenorhabdus vietnamensis TaxID=351656 RepID=A0A1Y2S810_9GAMM|nr:hypothetical protein Xvie_03847 [Xenorhabdus vietnamensis]